MKNIDSHKLTLLQKAFMDHLHVLNWTLYESGLDPSIVKIDLLTFNGEDIIEIIIPHPNQNKLDICIQVDDEVTVFFGRGHMHYSDYEGMTLDDVVETALENIKSIITKKFRNPSDTFIINVY